MAAPSTPPPPPPQRWTEACPAPSDAWLVDSPGCRIPSHEAFSKEVREYVYKYEGVDCADPPPLVLSNDTHIWVEATERAAHNATTATCCFRSLARDPGPDWHADPATLNDSVRHGNIIRVGEDCVPFDAPTPVSVEFVHATCTVPAGTDGTNATNASVVYEDYHGFVPDPAAMPAPSAAPDEDSLSVLILGMDSLSRLNMVRKMARTYRFLEERLGALTMLGYNKVEDNTFPNLVPLLSGLSVGELRHHCWPMDSAHMDPCPWVWRRFKANNYTTMFAEDTAWMGLFFYLKNGFLRQPTDYDPRPIMYLGENRLGCGGGYNAQYCIGQRGQIEMLFDYSLKFVRAMERRRAKFFSLVWGTSLSHDQLNQPDAADPLYLDFLVELDKTGVLNRTALVFMGDHGLRFGKILETYQGHLENMLPAMVVALPEWVRRRYPLAARNLECNRHSLLTVFDLHRTLDHFMNLTSLEDEELARAAALQAARGPRRGNSLFLPLPRARTCGGADIPLNYCACQRLSKADPRSTKVSRVAKFVVDQINAMLSGRPQCAWLRLAEVLVAMRGEPHPAEGAGARVREVEYQLTLRTAPGGALLSASVRLQRAASKDLTMQLAGSISRLNAYGSAGACVNSTRLRPLCFCLS